jgi:hypothetical protein
LSKFFIVQAAVPDRRFGGMIEEISPKIAYTSSKTRALRVREQDVEEFKALITIEHTLLPTTYAPGGTQWSPIKFRKNASLVSK